MMVPFTACCKNNSTIISGKVLIVDYSLSFSSAVFFSAISFSANSFSAISFSANTFSVATSLPYLCLFLKILSFCTVLLSVFWNSCPSASTKVLLSCSAYCHLFRLSSLFCCDSSYHSCLCFLSLVCWATLPLLPLQYCPAWHFTQRLFLLSIPVLFLAVRPVSCPLCLSKIEEKQTLLSQKLKYIEVKRTKLIPDIRKIKAKQPLLIPYIRKIKAKQTLIIQEFKRSKQILLIPYLKKIKAKQTLLVPHIRKIEAKQTLLIKNLKRSKRSKLSLFQK